MKGILLAGGPGSRLSPLTDVTNKHLLPVGNVPMIYWPLRSMKRMGIRDIMVVTGREHAGDVFQLLGSGNQLGLGLIYRVQDESDGIVGALRLAANFSRTDNICVFLGDNIFTCDIECSPFNKIILTRSSEAQRIGVVEIKNGKIIKIVEKPRCPKTNLVQTGCYFYDRNVWDVISNIKKSARGQYEISELNELIVRYSSMSYDIISNKHWCDAGTPDSYVRANEMVRKIKCVF